MKAMSTTLVIVVTAIVILVAAMVVITIFGGGMGQISTIAQAESLCETQAVSTCKSVGQLPPTWDVPTVNVQLGDGRTALRSCRSFGRADCSGLTTPTSPGTGSGSCIGRGQVCGVAIGNCCQGTCGQVEIDRCP
jgi:hypothetical protein